jgi:coenzyme F420-0:L-glutamate ligase/coenzyme F420-1:gamma-L-glutamate ligase
MPCGERPVRFLFQHSPFMRERFLRLTYYFSSVPMKKPSASHSRLSRAQFAVQEVRLAFIPGLPEIREREDLAGCIVDAARQAGLRFKDDDILVVAQKIVSKAEGAIVRLTSVKPSARARRIAKRMKKDPRAIEVILKESRRIVRSDRVLIAETHHGFVCANAGVDHSNVPGSDVVTLLPRDPDRSAKKLVAALRKRTGKRVAVIISDTFGRPWRLGLTDVAIGAAGVPVLLDLRGTRDRHGRLLNATILALADELASAAGLLMGKSEGTPVVLIRGYRYKSVLEPASRIIRPAREDLFR